MIHQTQARGSALFHKRFAPLRSSHRGKHKAAFAFFCKALPDRFEKPRYRRMQKKPWIAALERLHDPRAVLFVIDDILPRRHGNRNRVRRIRQRGAKVFRQPCRVCQEVAQIF